MSGSISLMTLAHYMQMTAIFLPDLSQLAMVLHHIEFVGHFTGLNLNLDETIAFDATAVHKLKVAGIVVWNAPIKYLGAFLGLGDLSRLNFEQPLHKAKIALSQWGKRSLTLDARILVIKTIIFSVFVHILNSVSVTYVQLDFLQKLIMDFLWKGCS